MNRLLGNRNRRIILFLAAAALLLSPAGSWLAAKAGPAVALAKPLWLTENYLLAKASGLFSYWRSKEELIRQNQALKLSLTEREMETLNYERVKEDNLSLRKILGLRKEADGPVAARVISHPWRTPYDLLIIDLGKDNSRRAPQPGQLVTFSQEILLGEVVEVFADTAKVRLFSAPGMSLPIKIGRERVPAVAEGRGGGNFFVVLPRDLPLEIGEAATFTAEGDDFAIAVVGAIETDPDESFQKVWLRYPLNLNQLRWVEIDA